MLLRLVLDDAAWPVACADGGAPPTRELLVLVEGAALLEEADGAAFPPSPTRFVFKRREGREASCSACATLVLHGW